MKGLGGRLALALIAATLIGLLALDLVFVFWLSSYAASSRRPALEAAAAQAARLAQTNGPSLALDGALQRLAHQFDVVVTLESSDGTRHATSEVPLPDLAGAATWSVEGGWEHYVVPLFPPWRAAVASHRRDEGLAYALGTQRWVALVLAGAGAIIVAFGLSFLRRAVLKPLSHLAELAAGPDTEQFDDADDLLELSRSIVTRNQRLAEDHAQIQAQLEALKRAHNDLEGAQQTLVRAERLAVVGQLAAGLAHEIGNPLAILSGFVEVLRDDGIPDTDYKDTLGRMAKELDRIHATVRNLLDFSRKKLSDSKEGELGEAMGHVQELLAPQERFKQIKVTWPKLERAVWVPVDVDALTQLLLNLMLNAADAVSGTGQVAIAVTTQDGKTTLDVDDSGPGIPAAVLPHIFEPFYTTKPPGSGTGLGLSVCERIVAAAGGDIAASTSPLGGARFRVTLPARAAPGQ